MTRKLKENCHVLKIAPYLLRTYCYRNTENMYATIHVAHNTEDSHTSMPVQQDPTYNDVEHSMKLPCRFNKESTTKKHIQI